MFLLAALVLVGQLADRALPLFVRAGTLSTASAWLLLLFSLSLWLDDVYGGSLRKYGRLCTVGALIGLVVAISALADHSLYPAAAHSNSGADEGMYLSPHAGVGLACLGLSLLLLDWETHSGVRPAQHAALVTAGVGLVTSLGYVNGVPILYGGNTFHPISIHESLALILMAVAVLAARPEHGILRLVVSDSAGGFLARSAPAVVIAVPMTVGWLTLKGQQRAGFDSATAVSVFVFATTVFFSILILRVARTLDRADMRRTRAEDLLRLRARQRASVADLSQRALAGADKDALAKEAVRLMVEALRVDGSELLEAERDDAALVVLAGQGPGSEPGASREASSLATRVMASGQSTIIGSLRSDHRLQEPRLQAAGVVSAALVPILSGTRRYGVLAVYSTDPRSFTDDDLNLLQTVAGILAAARDRATGERALRLSEQKFSGLFRSSPDAIAVLTLANERLQEVNDGFLQMTGFARDEVVGQPLRDMMLWKEAAALVGTVGARASVRNMELQLNTKSGDVRTGLCSTELVTLAGEACMLIVVRDISDRKRVQSAVQEANDRLARWVNELEDRGREISILSEMGELLQSCMSPEEACRITAKVARQLLPDSSGAVCMFADGGGLVQSTAVWGALSADEAVFGPQDCWALRRGRPHAVADAESGLMCAHVRHSEQRTYLCVPMIAQGEAIGVLHVRQSDDVFSGETTTAWLGEPKQRLVVAIADHTALALANLRLRDTLRNQSIRDPLTGLHNRRYMHEVIERELLRARRGEWSVGVLLLDLDHFKSVNDTYGHDAGDDVLRSVGRLFQERLRAEDIVCRYGGEEFVLVLPQTALAAAMERAEEIRGLVKQLSMAHRDQTIGPVTVSIGVSAFPEHGGTIAMLLEAADAALYQAKAKGRDCVESAVDGPTPRSSRGAKKRAVS
jgi:diguanylate cyclase (GGDEF)-like protein/PAS domain S-box-containing protein